jgi:hypothetical protein
MLPRFPQPAIEALLECADWRDVLNALSVDRRESPGRRWLINATGMFEYDDAQRRVDRREYERLIEKYPGSVRAMRRGKWPSWTPPDLQRITCVDDTPGRWDLPATLMHLSFSAGGSLPPSGFAFPPALKRLTAYNWHDSITPALLKSSITHLVIGAQRHHLPGSQSMPGTLKHLTIHGEIYYARFLLDLVLPEGLQTLRLPDTTRQPLRGVKWPTTLTHLHIGGIYDTHLPEGALPPALTHFAVTFREFNVLGNISWPKTITHLRVMETDWRDQLPPTLQVLVITSNSHRREETTRGLDRVVWPAALRHLTIPHRFLAGTPRPPKGCVVVVDWQPDLSW